MKIYSLSSIPDYILLDFKAVRSAADNLFNALYFAEVMCMYGGKLLLNDENNFDMALYLGKTSRSVVKSPNGYFSMHFPFKMVVEDGYATCNFDFLDRALDAELVYQLKTCLDFLRSENYQPDDIILALHDIYGLGINEANDVYRSMLYLLSLDHGYFRFDEDSARMNDRIHPLYHFDFFYMNQTTFKIGSYTSIDNQFFNSLFDRDAESPFIESS